MPKLDTAWAPQHLTTGRPPHSLTECTSACHGPSGTPVPVEPVDTDDVAVFVAYVTEKCRGAADDVTIPIDLRTARAIAARLDAHCGTRA